VRADLAVRFPRTTPSSRRMMATERTRSSGEKARQLGYSVSAGALVRAPSAAIRWTPLKSSFPSSWVRRPSGSVQSLLPSERVTMSAEPTRQVEGHAVRAAALLSKTLWLAARHESIEDGSHVHPRTAKSPQDATADLQ
jgi:hypothetical protein